ncbi:hypothetical protein [Flavobacterium sp. KACC 22763]|uniref:hypothetical protein n=1 Tax=Flavobacterium sp. KACC 22763 TaxID=3025668 RepID=UPI002366263F|nr:hypothetical protein [Flavobacterium sp. KACC 22763]WDF64744.1 hypothetical protein PQ463_01050 [Flavobacterium sp. KACC 22763]
MKSKFKNIFLKTNISLLLVAMISINLQAKKVKDTLFFKIDNSYLFERDYIPKSFFIKDRNGHTEFFFQEAEILHNLKPKQVLFLKYFIRNSKFYINEGRIALDIKGLMDYMKKYTIILIRENEEKIEYIRVITAIVIFD